MSDRIFANLVMVFGLIGILVGIGIFATDKSFLTGCQRGCWLEPLLTIFFGEQWGKRVLVSIWCTAGLSIFYVGLTIRKRAQKQWQIEQLKEDDQKYIANKQDPPVRK